MPSPAGTPEESLTDGQTEPASQPNRNDASMSVTVLLFKGKGDEQKLKTWRPVNLLGGRLYDLGKGPRVQAPGLSPRSRGVEPGLWGPGEPHQWINNCRGRDMLESPQLHQTDALETSRSSRSKYWDNVIITRIIIDRILDL
ncbi:hypothetical protein AAFF_G00222580 [Aldrovandia affinis]|uniref:Uncharacterized protein n=1 Tax=Aldrovandia affinis TaxID=143900 RepID=A0AAD7RFT2_9TELE|nr:hypothetical protein AAFF_G00222580 [Aldrovandia affinis]